MNIISNNCVGGFLYNKMNEKYKNPFIWMRITGESLKTLITQYDKIDFKKYELQKDENWNMYIIIDGKVKIHYSHYKFDKVYDKPTKVNDCIKYNKIWEYVVEKYEKHISNMSEEPYFVIDAWDGMYNDDKEQFKEKSTKEFLLELLKNDFFYIKRLLFIHTKIY